MLFRASALLLLLAAATVFLYRDVGSFDYVLYDDDKYITANPMVLGGITLEGIAAAFTRYHAANWHPLTWISHMLDVQLFGKEPGWPHRVNLLLHLADSILLAAVLAALTGTARLGIAVAALFALHPLHIESVAWISERKDVLSGFFWMLTVGAYVAYIRRRTAGRYLAVLLLFACGLLSKQMVVTLPFVLLLLDYWPLGRFGVPGCRAGTGGTASGFACAAREKLPMMLMAAAAAVVTLRVQREAMFTQVPLADRVANASVSLLAYLGKMFFPVGLTVYYPFPPSPQWSAAGVAAICIAGLTAVVVLCARRYPFLPVGWFWYLGTLVPVIGLVQVGGQAMADRYTYLPSIGVFMVVVWVAVALSSGRPAAARGLIVAFVVVLGVLIGVGRGQVRAWENTGTLFSHGLEVNRDDWVAHVNLAIFLKQRGKTEEAISHYREALRLRPGRDETSAEIFYNLGNALAALGRFDEAEVSLREAVELKPADLELHANLALVLLRTGRTVEAARHFAESRRIAQSAKPLVTRPSR